MENIDEHFHCRVIRAGDSLGAFDDRVDEVALAAVERFDDQRDALSLSERGEEAERLDVLLECARGGPALGNHAGTGTAHDHDRETFALFEFGKAEILLGKLEDGLSTLDGVLLIIAEDEPKDFDFILDIETRMVSVMRQLGRMEEADEVERRLKSVREALAEEPAPSEDGF